MLVWKRRYLVIFAGIVSSLVGLLFVHLSTFEYSANLKVTPVQRINGSTLDGGMGGLRGLASLAGISLPGSQDGQSFDLYLESYQSRELAEELLTHPEITTRVFASEWDPLKKEWHEPKVSAKPLRRIIKSILGMPSFPWEPPNGARLQEYLQNTIKIKRDQKTPIVTISIEHWDKDFALRLLNAAHEAVDLNLRRKALTRVNDNISYLTGKLAVTVVSEHRMAIAGALSEQEKLRMMTSSSTPFVAEPFGRAVTSIRPVKPKPIRDIFVAGLSGVLLGGFIALLLGFRERHR
jgi:capsular polysaccharide biosynthesis protein